ncbi:MAG: DUF465 domain-containing protein [Nitrospirae bacterium]|nr:DUF465 domain-containing protein [Nitrospirota bacterium]
MKEIEIAEALRRENENFRKLEEEHKMLKETLAEIDKKKYHTADEEIERKKIQKQKLKVKDSLAAFISDYKKNSK